MYKDLNSGLFYYCPISTVYLNIKYIFGNKTPEFGGFDYTMILKI